MNIFEELSESVYIVNSHQKPRLSFIKSINLLLLLLIHFSVRST